MRTILVLTGGRASDKIVFQTALSAARPLKAHMEFLHVSPDAAELARFTPHVDFARGAAVHDALHRLGVGAKDRSKEALHHFEELCETEDIEIAGSPRDRRSRGAAACWSTEHDDVVRRIVEAARHNDLTVIGRSAGANGLPPDLAERVLLNSGRPVLLAADKARREMTGTALVLWKETAESARALGAALPLLAVARKVVIVGAQENTGDSPASICHLVQRLEWNGIKAEMKWLRRGDQPASECLEAYAAEVDADVVVMGGYGHGRAREMVFGGCTAHFLERCDRPVLMMH